MLRPRTARRKSRGGECAAQVAGRGERRRTRGSKLFNSMYTEPGVAGRPQTTQSRKEKLRSRCGGHGPHGASRAAQNVRRKSQAAASAAGRGAINSSIQCIQFRIEINFICRLVVLFLSLSVMQPPFHTSSDVANAFRKNCNTLRYGRIVADIIINKIRHIILILSEHNIVFRNDSMKGMKKQRWS